jgi:hypothetical protein
MWAGDSSKAGQSSRSTEPPSPHCVRDRGVYRCRVPSARFANRGTDSSGCRSASGAPAGHTLDLSSGQTRERPTRPSKVFAPPGATDCRQRSTPVGRFTPLLFPSAMRGWRRRDCATFDSVDRCISTFIATSCSVLKGAIGRPAAVNRLRSAMRISMGLRHSPVHGATGSADQCTSTRGRCWLFTGSCSRVSGDRLGPRKPDGPSMLFGAADGDCLTRFAV